jgi:hypothetical protein
MAKMTKEEKQARRDHLRDITDAFIAGRDPEEIAKQYPALIARFSVRNCMLILAQKGDAVECAGFHDWKKVGRSVKKGEKGLAILVPMTRKARGDEDEDPVWFTWRYVFDISQTEAVQEVAA